MKKIMLGATVVAVVLMGVGCSSIQENYKPLYQAKPEKQALDPKGS